MRDPLNIALAIMTALLLVVGGAWLYGRLHAPGAGAAAVIPATQKRVTLEVGGMYCGNCATKVSEQLQGTPGVNGCEVDADAKRVWVNCERGVAESTLVAAVRRAGDEYTARVVMR